MFIVSKNTLRLHWGVFLFSVRIVSQTTTLTFTSCLTES
ncbi:hypothetical protein MIDIC_110093 [Alphaproteobacteria bacterium]